MRYFAIFIYNRGLGDNIMAYNFYKQLSIYCFDNNTYSLIYVKSELEKEMVELFHLKNIDIKIIGYTPKLNKINNFLVLFKKIYTFIDLIFLKNCKYLVFLDKSENYFTKLIVFFFKNSKIIGSSEKFNKYFNIKIDFNNNEHLSIFLLKFLPPDIIQTNLIDYSDFKILDNRLFDNFNKESKPYIVVAPGSGELEKHKRWPSKHYIELINLIINSSNLDIVLIGSNHENYLINSIFLSCKSDRVKKVFAKSLLQSLFFFKNAKFIITGDSGNAHLSSIMNKNLIILWGPTNKHRTAPLNKSAYFIDLNLPCSPCYDRLRTGCGNNICMKDIKPGNVFDIIRGKYDLNN